MIPASITFTDFESTQPLNDLIQAQIDRLERFVERAISCQVIISAPHKHQAVKSFHILLKLDVPGRLVIAEHNTSIDGAPEDLYSGIREAFRMLQRRTEAYMRKRWQPAVNPWLQVRAANTNSKG